MEKYSVITPKGHNWEYRCNSCSELRFSMGEEKPKLCGWCKSSDITVDRPGKLPTEVGK